MTKTKKILIWAGCIFFALILGLFILLGYMVFGHKAEDYALRQSFDSHEWKNRDSIDKAPYPRLRMVDDLLSKERFIGKTRDEVIALLGEPEKTTYFKRYDLVYWLGPERGYMSIDSEWLIMKLASSGKIAECKLATD